MKKLLIIAALAAIITALVVFDAQQYLTPDFYQQLFSEQPLLTGAIFFTVYVIATALSIPGAAALTLIGGAIFGLGWGLSGICPGPGLVQLVSLKTEFWLFFAAVLGGMWITKKV